MQPVEECACARYSGAVTVGDVGLGKQRGRSFVIGQNASAGFITVSERKQKEALLCYWFRGMKIRGR